MRSLSTSASSKWCVDRMIVLAWKHREQPKMKNEATVAKIYWVKISKSCDLWRVTFYELTETLIRGASKMIKEKFRRGVPKYLRWVVGSVLISWQQICSKAKCPYSVVGAAAAESLQSCPTSVNPLFWSLGFTSILSFCLSLSLPLPPFLHYEKAVILKTYWKFLSD